MKLKCFFGIHNYGSYNDITVVERINYSDRHICIETCHRICSDCKKTINLQREIDTSNTHSTTKWKKIGPSKHNVILA